MRTIKTITRRRKLALFVAIIMALTLWVGLPLQASALDETVEGIKYAYTESGGNATITAVDKATVTGELTIPSALDGKPVVAIGNAVFQECTLLTSAIIPDGVVTIGDIAFYGCTALASVSIPDSVTSIGASTFRGCSSLTSIYFSKNVTTIGPSTFVACRSLLSIEVDADNDDYSSADGVLFNKAKTTLIAYPAGNTRTNYTTIPDSVTTIGYDAFRGCTSLESITLPENVTAIGGYAFSECSSLESINIPDGVETIGGYTFGSCIFLTSVTIPDGVETIGRFAFYNCASLESLTLPESVTEIAQQAFQACPALKYIIIPASVATISTNLFAGSSQAYIYVAEGSAAETYVENNPSNTAVTVPVGGSVEGDTDGNIIFTLPDGGGSVTTPPGAQVAAGENGTIEITLPCEDGGDITLIAAPGSTVTADGSVTTLDGTPLVLTAGTVNRTSNTAATVRFTSSAAGTYYYAVVEEGAGVPPVDMSGAGTACDTTAQTISLSGLTAGAKDLYLVVKDADGSTSSATFKIAIPAYIPPPPPAPTYAVTVMGGSDGTNGAYAEGATVNITANAPASGKVFDTWTSSDGVTFANANSATTSFVMPAKAVTVTANYKDYPNAGGDTDDPPVADDGWVYANGVWKFYTDGEAAIGWIHDGKAWYYLDSDGEMQTGWFYDQSDKAWYYLAGNGAMKTGWVKDDGSWYYLRGDGKMVWGKWLHDADGNWYYLSGNGEMLTGKQMVGEKTYSFKMNGVWVG
jgi:hypothetical protein